MPNFAKSEGLYQKTESPVKESVEQVEGLYKKKQVATVVINNPNEDQQTLIKTIEDKSTPRKTLLKE